MINEFNTGCAHRNTQLKCSQLKVFIKLIKQITRTKSQNKLSSVVECVS